MGRLLKSAGFSLQSNAKTREGSQHPDRDRQFHYINEQVTNHQDESEPVISVEKGICGPNCCWSPASVNWKKASALPSPRP